VSVRVLRTAACPDSFYPISNELFAVPDCSDAASFPIDADNGVTVPCFLEEGNK
jgi:hypothetical protein